MPFGLFTALPYVGHLNPLLRQAEELQRRGWRVGIATAREMAPHVASEAPAVPFVDLGPLGGILDDLRRAEAEACADPDYRRGGMRFVPLLKRIWPVMFDGLRAAIERDRPDLLVTDIFSWFGGHVAEVTGVRLALNNPSLLTGVPLQLLPPAPEVPWLTTGQSIHAVGRVQRLAEPIIRRGLMFAIDRTIGKAVNDLRLTRGLGPATVDGRLRELPILVNGAFGLEYRRAVPDNVHLVGPMLPEHVPALPGELEQWLAGGPPVIYVNLGTVSIATAEQVARIAEGITVPGMRTLWVLKPAQASLLTPEARARLRIESWLTSPRALLAHDNVPVFVSHCGINSVHESLAAGTPIVGIPMLADQRDMAARVADAGVGVWMDKTSFTSPQLRGAIERVAREASFRDRLPEVQDAFARAGGVRRAADLLERAAAAQ